jgi:hypothetical protein
MEHDDPATRAPVVQAIKEIARISRTSTELRDKCEVLLAETQETDSLANNASLAEVAKAKSSQQNPSVPNDGG